MYERWVLALTPAVTGLVGEVALTPAVAGLVGKAALPPAVAGLVGDCLLYTSDAADDSKRG